MVQWHRISRQTGILTWKNLLVFYKSPIASVIKALLVPIAVTIVFCFLKNLKADSGSSDGLSHTGRPVMALPDAIAASSSERLVVATNGIHDTQLNNTITALFQDPGMNAFDLQLVDNPDALFDRCKQSIYGTSQCFAAVVFTAFNGTHADYIVGIDEDVLKNTPYSYAPGQSVLSQRLLPLQWALDAHLGGFGASKRPTEKMWSGFFSETGSSSSDMPHEVYWLLLVDFFAAPLFVFQFLVATYHISSTVAGERQNAVVDLLVAQGVTTTPRVLSNLLSFSVLYIPGVTICSILLGEILFVHTSTGLIFIFMLLASLAFMICAHSIGSFFSKSSVAGMWTSILIFALGLVSLAESLTEYKQPGQMLGLSLVFPPYAWATLIRDIATTEYSMKAFPDVKITQENDSMNGYLYFACFLLHIFGYGALIFLVEHLRWGVPQQREWTETSDEIALRLSNLSKTYSGNKQAVKDFNADVQTGSVTFLLGPNGSGKTTALKCISGVLQVDSGSRVQLSRDGRSFGFCPQNNVLWGVLSVAEHVRLWASLKSASVPSAQDIDDVISECDLTEKADAASETLSGGQKRRLQLAIAFSGGSKVCCIDEASSGLDPLSRRNIWNIIQEGRRHRTTILTTHFLDEADTLSDHIVIMCKGSVVCQGSSIALRAQYGDNYRIRLDDDQETTWKATSSAEATQQVLEMERLRPDLACHITFPTLEQVFLKTTSKFGTAVDGAGGDGMVGESQNTPEDSDTALEDKILALESEYTDQDLNLDVRQSVGLLRQIWVLFQKRYQLLYRPSGMVVYAVNLLLPIIVAAALTKYFAHWDALITCEESYEKYIHPVGIDIPPFYSQSMSFTPTEKDILGPAQQFQGDIQDALFAQSIGTGSSSSTETVLKDRIFVNSQDEFNSAMQDSLGDAGFGIYAPTPDAATFYHSADYYSADSGLAAFSLITNRIANSTSDTHARQMTTRLRTMRHVEPVHDWKDMPVSILIVIVFMASVSTAIIYPVYERVSNVRALEYSNGVSPFALWTAYLLFDLQFIIIQSLVVYGLLFVNPTNAVWYRPDCIFGIFILFGISSYLGTYLLSNIIRRGGFAAALGIHVLLFVLYIISYVANQYGGSAGARHDVYNSLQAGLGLIAPAANLARGLFIGMNTFDVLCGKYGDADTSYAFAYVRYGGVYANLVYQIIFLALILGIYEYAGTGWLRPLLFWRRKAPVRLHHRVDDGLASFDSRRDIMLEDSHANAARDSDQSSILNVSRVSKYFGRSFAAQNVSLSISANQTLALLGGNGAGKTTVINMIRGELRPDFGDIFVNGLSVLTQLRKARMNIGVCPQDDAVDNLTVRQTLEFYAAVKGLRRVRENVDQVLHALNITQYEKVTARALSGGTKRKLTVAIAILGNPPLLLLDEPSTGQDASAKRILWRALKRIRANRAILLTTHSMEEAEALASKVAIMRTSVLVSGSLQTLNDAYGGAFRLRGARCADVSADLVRDRVFAVFANLGLTVMRYGDTKGIVQFFIKYEKSDLGKILSAMEFLKGGEAEKHESRDSEGASGSAGAIREGEMKVFEDYTLIEPTLEEVFMNVVKEGE
ncbi:uncharacterized protein N7459_003344 [Penicillium hispanicum]|uniref:uncharacterized protein n=1 Tax=Penicillium hispanicum TaxID=1080232 RepID=UPI002541C6FC|nr:uncharacterized protein N7459_003344 [Penicillium hispanicum]KAJ5587579.1 hypothetical protein N7459_003344 [Penicillium hispanicum]